MEPSSQPPVSPRFEADPAPVPPKEKKRYFSSALSAIWQFIKFMVTLPVALFRGKRAGMDEVTVYSAHPSFFLWLLIIVGFASASIVRHYPDWAGIFGWVYVWCLLYFIATMLYDFSARKLGLWALILGLVWLGSSYVENLKHIAVLSTVFTYLADLKPKLDPGSATLLSWLLLLPWFGALLHMALNGRKRFTPNEIGEFHFGEGSELTDRTGLRFRTKYRDVLETLLTFGGGDLIAVDNHQNVIKRWDNIVGMYFFWNDLDRILHQRAVSEDSEKEKEA